MSKKIYLIDKYAFSSRGKAREVLKSFYKEFLAEEDGIVLQKDRIILNSRWWKYSPVIVKEIKEVEIDKIALGMVK